MARKTIYTQPRINSKMSVGSENKEKSLRLEQELRELISCGRLMRDAPGADAAESSRTDKILDELLNQVRTDGTAALSSSEEPLLFAGEGHENAQSRGRTQEIKILESIKSFVGEFQERIRQSLLKAMHAEEMPGLNDSFTTLARWDFSAPCPNHDCDHSGWIYSNEAIKKANYPRRCKCNATRHDMENYDLFDDRSNAFHFISEQVAESILHAVCTSRLSNNLGYQMRAGDLQLPIKAMNRKNKLELLTGTISENGRGQYLTVEQRALNKILHSIAKIRELSSIIGIQMPVNPVTGLGIENLWGIKKILGDCGQTGQYYSPISKIRDELAQRLTKFREHDPSLSGDELARKNGISAIHEWAQDMSIHILFALEAHDGLIGIIPSGSEYANETHHGNSTVRLSTEGTVFLDSIIKENDGLLTAFYSMETAPPMVCEPSDWVMREEKMPTGGYLTRAMRDRMPLITREALHNRLGKSRFRPTQELIDTLNMAQQTKFKVNEAMLEHQARSLLTIVQRILRRCVNISEGDGCIELSTKEGWRDHFSLLPDPNSLGMWITQIRYAYSLVEDPLISGGFYHPLRLDHRGRMYTNSTILDPQGDDFSRGLVSLYDSRQLTEEGWRWLRISVAKLWEGTELGPRKNSTFDELLAATENEKSSFVEMLYRIFNDPIETMDIWSLEGEDIMKSHSEAFQRLKATIAFAEAHSNGGIGAECDYIAVQDASSNIYQHTSLILRDREMARMVNVIPNDRPFDVYTRIAKIVGDPSTKIGARAIQELMKIKGLPEEVCRGIMQTVSTRGNAKSPVMTLGYGSGLRSLQEMMLTHNGKPGKGGKNRTRNRSHGKFDYVNLCDGKELQYINKFLSCVVNASEKIPEMSEYEDELKATIRINATLRDPERDIFADHPKWRSKVYEIILNGMGNKESWPSKEVLASWEKSMDESSYLSLKELTESVKSPFRKCAHPQSTLMRVLDKIDVDGTVDRSSHAEIASIITRSFRDAIIEVLPNYDLKARGNFSELLKNEDPVTWETHPDGAVVRHVSLTPPRSEPVRRRKGEQTEKTKHSGMASKRVFRNERDRDAERRALAPNLVHSLDAEHMRYVIKGLLSYQLEIGVEPHIWIVHDAFGCHPNDIEAMRDVTAEGLYEIHSSRKSGNETYLNILDQMHGGGFFDSKKEKRGIGTLDINELHNLDTKNWYFLT